MFDRTIAIWLALVTMFGTLTAACVGCAAGAGAGAGDDAPGPADGSLDGPVDAVAADAADAAVDAAVQAPFDTWVAGTPLPFGRYGLGAVAVGNRVYALGGDRWNNTQVADVVYGELQPSGTLGPWTPTTPLPHTNFELRAVAVDGFVYALAGGNAQDQQVANVYHAAVQPGGGLGPWIETTAVPAPRMSFGAVTYGDCVFVIGGNHGRFNINWNDVQMARALPGGGLGPWTAQSPLPVPIETHDAVIGVSPGPEGVAKTYLYVTGGFVMGQGPIDQILRAEVQGDCRVTGWVTMTATLPTPRITHRTVTVGQRLAVLGGASANGGTAFGDMRLAALPELSTWDVGAALPSPRFEMGAVVVNGHTCVIGGRDEVGALADVACLAAAIP